MSPNQMEKEGRRLTERFRRRRATFIKKAEQMRVDFDAQMYVVICRAGKFYTYNSLAGPNWPPPATDIVRNL